MVGVLSALISMFIGVTIGVCAGWFGGWLDRLLMKVTSFFITIPFIPAAVIILAAFTRSGIWTTAVILGVMSWAGLARLIRSQTMQIKTKDYILTIRAMGASSFYILTRHVIRELFPLLMYRASDRIKSGILSESSLSFLRSGDPISKSRFYDLLCPVRRRIADWLLGFVDYPGRSLHLLCLLWADYD